MTDWKELAGQLESRLRLRTFPVAYRRLEKAADLDGIPKVRRLDRFFTFCQLPALVRTRGWTVGATVTDDMNARCARIHGLAAATEETIAEEAASLSTTWFSTPEEARKQLSIYPRITPGEAIVLAPLASSKFDPDVVLLYGNPAQVMFVLNALQWKDYERFRFFFIGEGACADSLAQCYVSGKPSVAIPCFGERRFGEVRDEELVLALPPGMVEKAVLGLQKLSGVGLRFPIPCYSAECDPSPALARAYPDAAKRRREKKGG
ncbi:MAG: DUF169 domain-containing protein [Dehalococcoidia bacterium]|nr:DUF169 domain-containing protein [Dehalococcoidia bacterium]